MKCTVSLTSEKDILRFFDFLLENNLWDTLSIDDISSNSMLHLLNKSTSQDTLYYTPTSLCKEMIGPEWLNSKGLLSRKTALDFIHHQIKIRKMSINNGFLQTDEWFRTLFQDGRDCISIVEIPAIIEKLFESNGSTSYKS